MRFETTEGLASIVNAQCFTHILGYCLGFSIIDDPSDRFPFKIEGNKLYIPLLILQG